MEGRHHRAPPRPERGGEKKKRQPSLSARLSGLSVIVVGVMMVLGIAFKGQKAKGSCVEQHGKVTCKTKQLKHIPDDLPTTALVLHFGEKSDKQENHFLTIEKANFSQLPNLKELHLIKCGIEQVEPATFSDLKSLERLDLSYNKIQSMSAETFQGLVNLEYLVLSFNPLEYLAGGVFNGMKIDNLIFGNNPAFSDLSPDAFQGSQIQRLEFNKCNFNQLPEYLFKYLSTTVENITITNNLRALKLPERIFRNLKLKHLDLTNNGLEDTDFGDYLQVEELILNNNPLEELDDFNTNRYLENLKHLRVENCKLKSIKRKTIKTMLNLEILDVSDNKIQVLDINELDHLNKLVVLDVSDNDIDNFEGNFSRSDLLPSLMVMKLHDNEINSLSAEMEVMFSRLEVLTLHDNPLHCNCELKWLAKWLELKQHRQILHQYNSVMCHTPDRENFTQISNYGFQCRKPTILNATLDVDRVGLICTAEGDPAPSVTWITPKGEEKHSHRHSYKRTEFQTVNTLPLTRAGNYTCTAENIAGLDSIVVDTESTSVMMGFKFHGKSQKIKILETPEGFFITCVLIGILGLIFRNS